MDARSRGKSVTGPEQSKERLDDPAYYSSTVESGGQGNEEALLCWPESAGWTEEVITRSCARGDEGTHLVVYLFCASGIPVAVT